MKHLGGSVVWGNSEHFFEIQAQVQASPEQWMHELHPSTLVSIRDGSEVQYR